MPMHLKNMIVALINFCGDFILKVLLGKKTTTLYSNYAL